MFKMIKNIPSQYLDEFLEKQVLFIKSRVHLFCVLAAAIYFFASFIWYILYPVEFKVLEIIVGLLLVAGGGLIIYVNFRTQTIRVAKFNAYLFIAFLLVLLVKLDTIYTSDILVSSSIFVFTLFFVSVTIPWRPIEVSIIGFMHAIAYTANFLYIRAMPKLAGVSCSTMDFINGFIFLFMAFLLCVIIRWKETGRDIENFMLLKEVENKNKQMRRDLEWARRVNKTIVPRSVGTDKVEIAVSYLPAYYIGGDYVKFEFLDGDKLLFIVGDVTGHGVPAALLVNRVHAEFEQLAKKDDQPGRLLKELNNFIKEDFEGSHMYLSAFCGLVDLKKMDLSYSSYGHPPQYVYRIEAPHIQVLNSQTSLLGLPVEDKNVYQNHIKIDKGDTILLFTDGVTETVNGNGEEYGEERVEDFLDKNHNLPAEDFNRELLKELNEFKDGNFKDDVCILNIGIKAHWASFFSSNRLFKHRGES
jgi:serine phosphatase RsbU (regulator of sigma subunit)